MFWRCCLPFGGGAAAWCLAFGPGCAAAPAGAEEYVITYFFSILACRVKSSKSKVSASRPACHVRLSQRTWAQM